MSSRHKLDGCCCVYSLAQQKPRERRMKSGGNGDDDWTSDKERSKAVKNEERWEWRCDVMRLKSNKSNRIEEHDVVLLYCIIEFLFAVQSNISLSRRETEDGLKVSLDVPNRYHWQLNRTNLILIAMHYWIGRRSVGVSMNWIGRHRRPSAERIECPESEKRSKCHWMKGGEWKKGSNRP